MTPPAQSSLAAKYIVDDLPGAGQVGSRLHGILVRIEAGAPVSQLARDYLLANGLLCLHELVEGQTDPEAFEREAAVERAERIGLAKVASIKAAADDAKRRAERAAASASFFSDPAYKRRQEAKQLRRKFDVGYIEPEHYPRAIPLLRAVSQGQRLQPEDVMWLQTAAESCWTGALAEAWHFIEAEAFTATWHATGDPWAAVNASSHWRKCGKPVAAVDLTEEALARVATSAPKVRSALATTRGGALRDLDRHVEAKALGDQAHHLTPKDYRPCTLLGAVHIELGDLAAGHEWFIKAEQLGADQAAVDQDIRALLARAPSSEKERIRAFLLGQDLERFAWLQTNSSAARKGTR